jgi:uncharacterized protein YceH (UPF0502 family)
MALQLSETEIRVLGALIEKESTTPEYYPLSLNALLNACNQKSNRDPVTTLDEHAVRHAIRTLSEQALVRSAGGDSRVPKFEHRINELYNFHRNELAILCVLLLRGPQTPGELRTRTDRLYSFDDLEAVHSALSLLMRRDLPLVKILPRQPGTKEARYTHLLGGDTTPTQHSSQPEISTQSSTDAPHPAAKSPANPDSSRIVQLESEVAELKSQLESLREQFAAFQKQFQ